MRRLLRLFVIKTRVEAYLIIFALATGAMERGKAYLALYPGFGGQLLFWACSGSVVLAGAKILDALRYERRERERRDERDGDGAAPPRSPATQGV